MKFKWNLNPDRRRLFWLFAFSGFMLLLPGCKSESSSSGSFGKATESAITVVSTVPANNANDVPVEAAISVTFSNIPLKSSVSANTSNSSCEGAIMLSKDEFATCVQMDADFTFSDGGRTISISPLSSLDYDSTYKIRIGTEIADGDNRKMQIQYTQPVGFKTVQDSPPAVTGDPPAVTGDPPAVTGDPPAVVDRPDQNLRSGILVDSPVAGIHYKTATQSGKTDASGSFRYRLGETVTFSIGDLELPPARASSRLTPLDLAGTHDYNDPKASNIARLLQSLDKDGNPDNGIRIDEEAHESTRILGRGVDFRDDNFGEQLRAILNELPNGRINHLKSPDQAREHLRGTLGQTAGFLIGKISGNTSEARGREKEFKIRLTKQPEGEVVINLASSDESEGRVSNPNGQLKFTPGDFDTEQSVKVVGQNDEEADGDRKYEIRLTVDRSLTEDPDYRSLEPRSVTVWNIDDEVPSLIVGPVIGDTSEKGGQATFSVELNSPPDGEFKVRAESDTPTEGVVVQPRELTLTRANYNKKDDNGFIIKGQDDNERDGNRFYRIVLTVEASEYDQVIPRKTVRIRNIDDEGGGGGGQKPDEGDGDGDGGQKPDEGDGPDPDPDAVEGGGEKPDAVDGDGPDPDAGEGENNSPPYTLSGRVTYQYVPFKEEVRTWEDGDSGTTKRAYVRDYLDYAEGREKSVRNVIIQLIDSATDGVIDGTQTNENGRYVFRNISKRRVKLRVRAELKTPRVFVEDNTRGDKDRGIPDPIHEETTPSIDLASTSTHNIHLESGMEENGRVLTYKREAGPFAILDAVHSAVKEIKKVRPRTAFPDLHINWSVKNAPYKVNSFYLLHSRKEGFDVKIGRSYYNYEDGEIYLLGRSPVRKNQQFYMHEHDQYLVVRLWALFFQDKLGRSDFRQNISKPSSDYLVINNYFLDPRLAFNEGWAFAFSSIVFGPYNSNLGKSRHARTGKGYGFDIRHTVDEAGWYHPRTVGKVIYLLDQGDDDDLEGLGLGPIIDVMTGETLKNSKALITIFPFIHYLRQANSEKKDEINKITIKENLSHIGIDPWDERKVEDSYGFSNTANREIKDEIKNNNGDYKDLPDPEVFLPVYRKIKYDRDQKVTLQSFGRKPFKVSIAFAENQYLRFEGRSGRTKIKVLEGGYSSVALKVYQAGKEVAPVKERNDGITVPTEQDKTYIVVVTNKKKWEMGDREWNKMREDWKKAVYQRNKRWDVKRPLLYSVTLQLKHKQLGGSEDSSEGGAGSDGKNSGPRSE